MTSLIVDASVAVKWFVQEEGSAAAAKLRLRKVELVAPEIILAETGNALWKHYRRGAIGLSALERAAAGLALPFLSLIRLPELVGPALLLAAKLGHPIYDCFYLALALRDGAPIATADRRLAALAARIDVEAEVIGG